MSATPSFILPACPACSSLITVERPIWRYARHTSAARKVPVYTFSGCRHAEEVGDPKVFRSEAADWAAVQAAWAARTEELLRERTARWTDAARNHFRRAISDKPELVILGQQHIPLSPEAPAQQNNENEKEEHHGRQG